MRKLPIAPLFLSLFLVHSAFAQNLGQLSPENAPQRLVSVTEIQNFLNSPDANRARENQAPAGSRNQNDLWGWGSYYGGWGWPSYYGGWGWWADEDTSQNQPENTGTVPNMPNMPNTGTMPNLPNTGTNPNIQTTGTNPNIQSSGTNPNIQTTGTIPNMQNTGTTPSDAAHTPFVCFANDHTGTWFGRADLAMNVAKAQEAANRECSAAGGNCHLNLGCAIPTGNSSANR